MTTREQDNTIERISLAIGGRPLAIGQPYSDGSIDVTRPNGHSVRLNEDGREIREGLNFSINWAVR